MKFYSKARFLNIVVSPVDIGLVCVGDAVVEKPYIIQFKEHLYETDDPKEIEAVEKAIKNACKYGEEIICVDDRKELITYKGRVLEFSYGEEDTKDSGESIEFSERVLVL